LYIVRDLISLGELTHVYLMFRDLYSVNSTYQLHKYNEPIFLLSTSTDISHETVSLWWYHMCSHFFRSIQAISLRNLTNQHLINI